MNTPRRAGLTLVELLIVLTILAIMTTMAVTATSSLVDQARYDATQRTLLSVDEAIVGHANAHEADGSLIIDGFVADIGRLPLAVIDASDPDEAYKRLRELWLPGALPIYGIFPVTIAAGSPDGGPADTVALRCGWRGPYLRLSPASTGSTQMLRDGWGNPFDILFPTRVPAGNGQEVGIVRSRGADGAIDVFPPPTDYTSDQRITARATTADPVTGEPMLDRIGASVTVNVKVYNPTGGAGGTGVIEDPKPADGTVVVRFFGPVNGAPAFDFRKFEFPAGADAMTPYPVPAFNFTGMTIGQRAIRAYQGTTKRSAVMYLMIPPGGPPVKTLVLYPVV